MKYKDQLKNQLWLNKRAEILERDGYKCCICGNENKLQVHHKRYIAGRNAWEYSQEDLVTLCNKCHYRLHYKEESYNESVTFVTSKNFVIFRSIMSDDSFKPSERIIYSILASFAKYQGKRNNGDWYEYKISNIQQFCKDLNITRRTYYRAIDDLSKKKLLKGNLVLVPQSLIERGYFKLYNYDKIGNLLLIFYSYLKDRSSNYSGVIDTYKDKLAECLCTTKTAITKLLNRLYVLKLAKRLKNGELLVL